MSGEPLRSNETPGDDVDPEDCTVKKTRPARTRTATPKTSRKKPARKKTAARKPAARKPAARKTPAARKAAPRKRAPAARKSGAADGRYWVGFDLGGTKMMATVFDANLSPVGRKRRKTRGRLGARAGLERLCETIDMALADAGVSATQLGGIGVGCPGPLDLDRGVVLDMPNLGWTKVPVKRTLEKRFGCPAFILNDVDAGVYGESVSGAGKGARTVVGVFPGTGIGGGAVYEGRVVRGRTGSCMEIGHIPAVADGPLCGCGQRGCLEAVASRLAIAAEAAKAAYRGDAPHLFERAGTNLSKIRSGLLAESIANGDTVIESIVRHAARTIGVTMAGIVNTIAPDIIVLGGGLAEAMPELFLEEVGQGIETTTMKAYRGTYDLVVAQLGDDAGVIGTAAWARTCVV